MRIAFTAAVLMLFAIPTADASEFAFHERVDIKEMKAGGKVVGARIKLTLRPDSTKYTEVLIGIGPGAGGPNANNRALAGDPKAGFLLHQFPAIKDFKPNQPKVITLNLKYSDATKIKPGQDIQIISAWVRSGDAASHVYGMTRSGFVSEKSYKLPKAKTAQQQRANSSKPRRFAKTKSAKTIRSSIKRTGKARAGKAGPKRTPRIKAKSR